MKAMMQGCQQHWASQPSGCPCAFTVSVIAWCSWPFHCLARSQLQDKYAAIPAGIIPRQLESQLSPSSATHAGSWHMLPHQLSNCLVCGAPACIPKFSCNSNASLMTVCSQAGSCFCTESAVASPAAAGIHLNIQLQQLCVRPRR